MAFDPTKFGTLLQQKLGEGKPTYENWQWLAKGSSGFSLQDVLSNWNQLDPKTQQGILAQDITGGGAGGALSQVVQAQQNGLDPSLINQAISGMQSGQNQNQIIQNLQQQNAQQSQLNSQNAQLQAFNKQYQGQMFGTDAQGNPLSMIQSLQGNTGTIGALNQFETGQTAQTFNQLLQPEIQMALGGQGLENSGASVELNSRALAQLQMAQQQNIMQAALGAQSQEQGLQQQQVLGNIAGQQGMVANTLNTNNAYMTMQFQQQLMQQQADLARQLSSYGGGGAGGGGIGSMIGGGIGAIGGAIVGGPQGAMMGYGLGSSLGGSIGNAVSPGSSGQGTGALGSNFFAASSMLPRTWGSTPTAYTGPMNSGGSPWSMTG